MGRNGGCRRKTESKQELEETKDNNGKSKDSVTDNQSTEGESKISENSTENLNQKTDERRVEIGISSSVEAVKDTGIIEKITEIPADYLNDINADSELENGDSQSTSQTCDSENRSTNAQIYDSGDEKHKSKGKSKKNRSKGKGVMKKGDKKRKLSNKEKRYRSPSPLNQSKTESGESSSDGESISSYSSEGEISSDDGSRSEQSDIESDVDLMLKFKDDALSSSDEEFIVDKSRSSHSRSRSRTLRKTKKHRRRDRSRSQFVMKKTQRAESELKRKKKRRQEEDNMMKIVKLVKQQLMKECKREKGMSQQSPGGTKPSNPSPLKKLPLIKSPSEATAYTPAVPKNLEPRSIRNQQQDNNIQDQVTMFLKNMRIVTGGQSTSDSEAKRHRKEGEAENDRRTSSNTEETGPNNVRSGRELADNMILDAE